MVKQHRLAAVALALGLLCGAVAGCTGRETAKSPPDKTATLLFSFTASTLDPHNDWAALRVGITETLVRLDENLSLQPLSLLGRTVATPQIINSTLLYHV